MIRNVTQESKWSITKSYEAAVMSHCQPYWASTPWHKRGQVWSSLTILPMLSSRCASYPPCTTLRAKSGSIDRITVPSSMRQNDQTLANQSRILTSLITIRWNSPMQCLQSNNKNKLFFGPIINKPLPLLKDINLFILSFSHGVIRNGQIFSSYQI